MNLIFIDTYLNFRYMAYLYILYFQMDYLCAFSVVMYSLLAFLLRSIGGGLSRDGSLCGSFTTTWISIISCIGCFAFFLRHVHRMVLIHFDYGYNMQVYEFALLTNNLNYKI